MKQDKMETIQDYFSWYETETIADEDKYIERRKSFYAGAQAMIYLMKPLYTGIWTEDDEELFDNIQEQVRKGTADILHKI